MGSYIFSFFFNLADKNLLIVENFSSVAKMVSTVYETENCSCELKMQHSNENDRHAMKSEHFMVTKIDESLKVKTLKRVG